MPHGEDTSRDPKRKVTRLAHLMTNQANRYWERVGGIPDETPEGTQEAMEMYRDSRNILGADNYHIQGSANLVNRAFKNRHNENFAAPLIPFQTK